MRYGFVNDLVVKLIDPLSNDGRGTWEYVEPHMYRAKDGTLYTVPPGFTTDFCSVPRIAVAYYIAGDRFHAEGGLHDHLCRSGIVPRETADDLFVEAMEARLEFDYKQGAGYESLAKLGPIVAAMGSAVRGYTYQIKTHGQASDDLKDVTWWVEERKQ